MNITFASLLTPEGVVAAAAMTTALVALILSVFPLLAARVSGALLAFGITAVIYVLCAVSVGVSTLDAGLLVFISWVSCATSSVGINSTVRHVQSVTT